jgi:hypothetical protein
MNTYRKFLRIWLTVSSFIGFITGWVFLSHTSSTSTGVTQVGNTAMQLPAIQAIPTLIGATTNTSALNNVQTFTVNIVTSQIQNLFSPRMRTGGS